LGNVSVQFAGIQNEATILTLDGLLSKNGIRVLDLERIDKSYGSSIKYFHDEDKALAEQVLKIASGAIPSSSGLSQPKLEPVKGLENKVRLHYVEVWLH